MSGVRLEPCAADDLWLTERIETDPRMMKDLGGPMPAEKIPAIHARRIDSMAAKGAWWLKILPEPGAPPAGTIGLWETEFRGQRIHEMGWMILPEHQGRGLATAAGRLLLDRARAERKAEAVHAFPNVANAASNALCRRLGFSRLGECGLEYAGRPLRCGHWRLQL